MTGVLDNAQDRTLPGVLYLPIDSKDAPKTEKAEPEDGLCQDPEPWPDPVDGAELLNGLAEAARRFIILPESADTLLALWVIHSHAHDEADHSPVLAITSPEKRCGKTTALSVIGQLVRRPLHSSNITAPALFRTTEKYQPTLLIDEADTFLKQSEELRGILNSGHAKESASVIRLVGDSHEPTKFRTWAPKVVALIGVMPDTLSDRAVALPMRRKRVGESIERLRSKDPGLQKLCRQAARWVSDIQLNPDPEIPDGLHDRAADNWRALLAIADAAGGVWPRRARDAAIRLSGGADDDSARVMLLQDMKALFEEKETWASSELVGRLAEMEHRPWPEWRKGQRISARQVATLLRDFGISPHQISSKARGYRARQFEDAFARYLPSQVSNRHESRNDAGFSDSQSVTDAKHYDGSQPPESRTVKPNVTDRRIEARNAVEGEL